MQNDKAREPRKPKTDQPQKGLFCPVCHCRHVPVLHTRQDKNQVRRHRECRSCGHRFWTAETIF